MSGTADKPEQKHAYDKAELIACGRGDLFGRDTARLPIREMLMLDRVILIDADGGEFGKGVLKAELDIRPDLWFFDVHFVDDPVMPGCLGLDAMWQLVGFYLAWSGYKGLGRAIGVGEVKFTGQVMPDAKLVTYEIHMKRVISRKLAMGVADGLLIVDGETIYTAKDLKVGLFERSVPA